MISLERVFCYLQGNNSINTLKREFKIFLCLEGFPYIKGLLKAGTTVMKLRLKFLYCTRNIVESIVDLKWYCIFNRSIAKVRAFAFQPCTSADFFHFSSDTLLNEVHLQNYMFKSQKIKHKT